MSQKQKRQVYLGLAGICVALFIAGLVVGFRGRHTAICKDGRPPKQQQDDGLGRVLYLCHNGQIVTKP